MTFDPLLLKNSRLNSDPKLKVGDVTSVNVNIIRGGVQHNVVPSEFTVSVDMRVSPFDKEEVICGWVWLQLMTIVL